MFSSYSTEKHFLSAFLVLYGQLYIQIPFNSRVSMEQLVYLEVPAKLKMISLFMSGTVFLVRFTSLHKELKAEVPCPLYRLLSGPCSTLYTTFIFIH